MFYVFWTCPKCNRNHRFVWNDADSWNMVEFHTMKMICGDDEDLILGSGCGQTTEMAVVLSKMPIEGRENGFAVLLTVDQRLNTKGISW